MNILFISYAEVSLCGESVRTVAMLNALADAGHHVDLVAPHVHLPSHSYIRVLSGNDDKPCCRATVYRRCLHAVGRGSYDAIHAIDQAVFFATQLSRWKKLPLVYDAAQCFTRKREGGTSKFRTLFSKHYRRIERNALDRASIIFSPCSALTLDLHTMEKEAPVLQLEDVPVQPLYARQDIGKTDLLKSFGKRRDSVVVCCVLPKDTVSFRTLLMAVRKVIDVVPETLFFFKGNRCDPAKKMATNLDIIDQCIFLSDQKPETFLSALNIADAILLLPQGGDHYIHPQVYTLLHAGAPLVTIHNKAYDELLTEKTTVRVLSNSESIAEGLLRVIKEPLFSQAIATEGQQLVAARYTYSSFKHKVRMAYHSLFNPE